MGMKRHLCALLATVLLLFTACTAPAPSQPESASPPPSAPPESAATPDEPAPKEIPNYYVEEVEDGIKDLSAVESLYWYLWGNLTPKDYRYIGTFTAVELSPERTECYCVEICASDKSYIDSLLKDYDGPWAPLVFHHTPVSLFDHAYAEIEMKRFLEAHPEIEVKDIVEGDYNDMWWLYAVEPYDELQAFIDNYPIQGVFGVSRFVPEEEWNPD